MLECCLRSSSRRRDDTGDLKTRPGAMSHGARRLERLKTGIRSEAERLKTSMEEEKKRMGLSEPEHADLEMRDAVVEEMERLCGYLAGA